jgi:acetoacetyl-CoA synthetase
VTIVDLKLPQQAVAAPGDEDIPARLCRIWSRVLNTSSVTADSDFFELGGDSLLAVNLLLEIERETGLSFPVTTIYDAPTIALQVELIAGERQSAFSPLVLLKPGEDAAPLFIVHGIGGTVFELASLAHGIQTERAVYAIQARGIDGNEPPRDSIADMAAAYVETVRAVQPEGPYCLAGYSMGGLVALEMARNLLDERERVEFLLLIDSYAHPMTWPRAARLGMKWRFNRARLLRACERPIAETAKNLTNRVKAKFGRPVEGDRPAYTGSRWPAPPEPYLPPALREVHEAGARALLDYTPHPYLGKIVFVKAETTDIVYPTDAESIWRSLAQPLQLYTAPGDHLALVREHHASVARCFSSELAKSDSR